MRLLLLVAVALAASWAQASLTFECGAVAQLSACRTAIDPIRQLKVRCDGFYAEADLAQGVARTLTPGPALAREPSLAFAAALFEGRPLPAPLTPLPLWTRHVRQSRRTG